MKIIFLSFLLLSSFCLITNAQKTNLSEQKALRSLQEFYSLRDYESGYELGRKVSAKFPQNTEIQAWYVLNTISGNYNKEALALTEKLAGYKKDDIWTLFALANIYNQNDLIDKAKPISEKLIGLAPQNEEIIFLYSSMLSNQKEYDKALDFLQQKSSQINNKSRLLNEKAKIYYLQNEKEKSFANFIEATKIDPNDVNSNYFLGFYLNKNERFDEALKYLQRAIELSPKSYTIREEYWNAIWKSKTDNPREQRKQEISADIDSYYKTQNLLPATMLSIVNKSREFQLPDKEKQFSNLILSKFPTAKETERIWVNKYRAINYRDKDGKIDEVKKAEYIKILKQFIARPKHFEDFFLGEAYSNLIYVLQKDAKFSNPIFLQLSKRAIKYRGVNNSETYSIIVFGLLYRRMFAEAEIYARLGISNFDMKMEELKKTGENGDFIKISEKFDKTKLLNNLGEALIALKKYDEAERILSESAKIDKETNYVYNVFGKLYEAQNNYKKAEDAYIEQLSISASSNYQNYDNVKNLYQKQNGKLDGYEDYLQNIKQSLLERRKAAIISQREKNPQDLTSFNLKSFTLRPVSSNDLQGKVIVINLWATWCGPCVAELPEFQKLYEKYKDNLEVSVLTINFEEDADTIRNFMETKKYNFPVLMSEKYISQADIAIFPTTWFVDKNGKKAFIKFGTSQRLFEEFNWRIEELNK